MLAGPLDRRITLQQYGITYNADNEPVEGFSDLATVWASVQYVSDAEKVRAAEVGASISVRFQIRYSSTVAGLNPKDRVLFDGDLFDISGVKPLGRREGLEISADASADEADAPVTPPYTGGFDFSDTANSQYIALL